MMTAQNMSVGVAYNEYTNTAGQQVEHVSEETVKDMAEEVYRHVSQLGYRAEMVPLFHDFIDFINRLKNGRYDVVVNLCEGFKDRPLMEAHVAGVYELFEIPYTGNPARTLSICQNKYQTKLLLQGAGLPTPAGQLVSSPGDLNYNVFPAIVKPNNEDASLGIYPQSVVHNLAELQTQVAKVITTYNQPALVEQYVHGREFNVAVMDLEQPLALPVSEIDFSTVPEGYPHICSYEAKWFEGHVLYNTTIPKCPAPINDSQRQALQSIAVQAFKLMNCRDYARVDFRMSTEGQIYILEVNPNPDISLNAGYVRALRAAQIEYGDFWNRIILKTLKRKP
jgi:D-alanine-D-alanine ligase